MKRFVFALAAILGCCYSVMSAQAAEDCRLHQVAALKLQSLADGSLAVPVTLDGKQALFGFGFDPFSFVLASYADAAGFEKRPMPKRVQVELKRGRITGVEIVPSFALANASGSNVQFLRAENTDLGDSKVVGQLGMDILSNFDIELDFANGAVNLFTHDHCRGNVVYWSKAAYAQIPYRTDLAGHPTFEMQLDGKLVTVAMDANPGAAEMQLAAARRLFGIDENSEGLAPVRDPDGREKEYRYSFKTLSVDGVSIGNPAITLFGSSTDTECRTDSHRGADGVVMKCFGGSDIRLGLQEFRALHLFMATKEKMLYVTPARREPHRLGEQVAAAPEPKLPDLPVSLHCSSPDLDRAFIEGGPRGHATAKVTFNINSSGGADGVHVTPATNGVCTVTAKKGTVIASSSFAFDTDSSRADAQRELLKHVDIAESVSGDADAKVYTFTVKAKDQTPATLTLDFPVDYRAEGK